MKSWGYFQRLGIELQRNLTREAKGQVKKFLHSVENLPGSNCVTCCSVVLIILIRRL